jgi:ankyrin repeat protein
MEQGANPQKVPPSIGSKPLGTPFEEAVRKGHLALVRQMIQDMDDFDVSQKTASEKTYLHHACEAGQAEVAALLIESGASLEVRDIFQMTPLQAAFKQGSYPLAHLLLAASTFIPEGFVQPEAPLLKNLVAKYQPAYRDAAQKGETPLHTAVRLGDQRHLRLLCRVSDIHAQNKQGMTALQVAEELDAMAIVQFLRGRNGSISRT